MKIKIAELIRKIKATSKKAEEALSALSENIVNISISEKESESDNLDTITREKFDKIIAERTTTTNKALEEFNSISAELRGLRFELDAANSSIKVDYNGSKYILKDIVLTVSIPQMSEKEKKKLQDELVAEIRKLDIIIQQTNWNEEIEI